MENKSLFLNEESKKLLGYEVGSRLHEDWKSTSKEPDETTRQGWAHHWRPTKDDKFYAKAQKNPDLSEVLRIADGIEQVDIANMSFEELPAYWQKTNLEAGLTAAKLVTKAINKDGSLSLNEILSLSPEQIEELGDAIHEAWMERTEKEDYNADLFVPYSQLPREEQIKDLNHVRVTLETLKELLTQELSMEELRNKYKDMDKNKSVEH